MSDSEALAGFTGKWRARWPEWGVAEVFVPRAQREIALAWAALQQELTDAAWGGSDPLPGQAKLGWWQEELAGWSRGARRHPLGTVLQRLPAPWMGLATSLPTLAESRERPGDADEAFAVLASFADAVQKVDEAILRDRGATDADVTDGDTASGVPARRLITAMLLHSRFAHEGDGHVPLSVIARAGEGDPMAIWAQQLQQRWPGTEGATRTRCLWAALARMRLRRGDATGPLSPWTALRSSWRAARNG